MAEGLFWLSLGGAVALLLISIHNYLSLPSDQHNSDD